MILNNLLYCCS